MAVTLELSYKTVVWEAERISLIKKKCYKYDEEWRMIRPSMSTNPTYIKMRPCKVLLGNSQIIRYRLKFAPPFSGACGIYQEVLLPTA